MIFNHNSTVKRQVTVQKLEIILKVQRQKYE